MATTFQQRVEAYVGDISVSDTDLLDTWLKEEAIAFISIMPEFYLSQFKEWVATTTSLASGRFLNRVRLDNGDGRTHQAKNVAYERLDDYLDEDSLYYATENDPVYAVKNSAIVTAPETLVSHTQSKMLFLSYPSPTGDSTTITGYPVQLEEYVVLGAAIKALVKTLYEKLASFITVAPTAPAAPAFTYTDVTGTTTTSAVIDISGIAVPTYAPPTDSVSFTVANTLINTEEDIELAEAELAQQNSKLNQYNLKINDASKEFEEDVVVYKTEVETKYENAKLFQQALLNDAERKDNLNLANKAKILEAQVSAYLGSMQKFQHEVELYQIKTIANTNQVDKYLNLLAQLRQMKFDVLQSCLGQLSQGKEK